MTDIVEEPPVNEKLMLLQHCEAVYKKMQETAQPATEGFVFTGVLTQLFEDVGLGQPYYTAVMRKLKGMDCVRQIRRGGGQQPSKWLLLQPPSQELYNLPEASTGMPRGKRAVVEQQHRDLNQRLLRLEAWARGQGYQG
jgi:hypothetical protein